MNRQRFNPFPGLRPFRMDEKHLFFGREEQTRELLQRLRDHRFLAVVGTSGSGKSSLVQAGLLPQLYGGTMLNIFEGKVVALERHGNTLYLVQKPHRFPADPDTPIGRAVDLTFGSSVVETAKIESIREDSAMVIDVTDWFVSDLSGVGRNVGFAASTQPGRPGNANFDRSRSYLGEVKSFDRNTSIEAKLTAEQKVQQKSFELDQARKDAEIEIARAEGAAKAQEIVRSTLSDSYLQYLWIKTLNENPNVIYVATEANMPIFRTTTGRK